MSKTFSNLMITAAISAALALGAAAQDHIVVPLSHPSQPAMLKVGFVNGSITVHAYEGKDIVIDTSNDGSSSRRHERERQPSEDVAGMHKLTTAPGISAEEDNNVVTIRSSMFNGGDANITVQVPVHTSLNLHTVNGGSIQVQGVDGDINVDNTNGSVTLDHVAGSVVAHALNGRVMATITRLDATKPSSFSSLNGNLDITLPADAKANVRMKSDNGDIFVDDGFNFQVTRGNVGGTDQGQRDSNGMYRVKIDRNISGTLNGGGPDLRIENFNGNIYLRKAH
ncbi:MAG TPA: DUF4097 family beta strand repeat-containing protein [Terriglobales bacterium]|nr:DUF4097 family beta strand repeat-containing protein [Terriglobales bacterium]